jgi:hypothetical protein
MRYNVTLYFKSKESAVDSGYCDAVETDEEDYPYMSVMSFFADHYDVEADDDLFEMDDDLEVDCE